MADMRLRLGVQVGIVTAVILAACMLAMHVTGNARLLATLLAMTLAPGGAVLTRLPTVDLAAWFGLAVTISVSIETVLCVISLWCHQWHPYALGGLLAVLTLPVLLVDIGYCIARVRGGGLGRSS
jgi:hypothetical protein